MPTAATAHSPAHAGRGLAGCGARTLEAVGKVSVGEREKGSAQRRDFTLEGRRGDLASSAANCVCNTGKGYQEKLQRLVLMCQLQFTKLHVW